MERMDIFKNRELEKLKEIKNNHMKTRLERLLFLSEGINDDEYKVFNSEVDAYLGYIGFEFITHQMYSWYTGTGGRCIQIEFSNRKKPEMYIEYVTPDMKLKKIIKPLTEDVSRITTYEIEEVLKKGLLEII